MLRHILRPLLYLSQAFTDADSTPQLALGFALGMWIGLVPKGNLIAAALVLVLMLLRVNLGMGTLGALLFSWVGVLTDPLTHRIGLAVLSPAGLRPFWGWLHDRPLMPWTHFNNTVVMGSLVLGGCLFYPVYYVTRRLLKRHRPWITEKIQEHKVHKLLSRADRAAGWSLR